MVRSRAAPYLAALRPDEDRATALPVARTDGSRIVLEDGRELIDGIASWWTACHGYNHPHIRAAVRRQLDAHAARHVRRPGARAGLPAGGAAGEPAARATSTTCSSPSPGSVSVEIAMKMALQYWINRGVRGRTRFLAFRGGYHGDTLATMTVCDPEEGMHRLFAGRAARAGDRRPAARRGRGARRSTRCWRGTPTRSPAILVEPLVQGAGGMLFHDAGGAAPPARGWPTGTTCC